MFGLCLFSSYFLITANGYSHRRPYTDVCPKSCCGFFCSSCGPPVDVPHQKTKRKSYERSHQTIQVCCFFHSLMIMTSEIFDKDPNQSGVGPIRVSSDVLHVCILYASVKLTLYMQ